MWEEAFDVLELSRWGSLWDATPALRAYTEEFGERFLVVKIITDPMVNVVCYFGAKFRCVMPPHVLRSEHYPKDGEEEEEEDRKE